MPDPADAFLDAAVRSFDDNAELQMVAKRELAVILEDAPVAPDMLAEATRRFDEVDRGGGENWGKWCLSAMLLAVAGLLVWSALGFYQNRKELRCLKKVNDHRLSGVRTARLWAGLPLKDALLLNNDAGLLLKSDRRDPVLFADHLLRKWEREGVPPADILNQAEELDPGNGFHSLLAAAASSGGVNLVRQSRVKGAPAPLPKWHINDEVRWLECLRLLEQAAAAPRFESYQRDLLRRRLEILPAAGDALEQVTVRSYFAQLGQNHFMLGYKLGSNAAAKADHCLMEGDAAGLRELIGTWDRLSGAMLDDFDGLVLTSTEVSYFAGTPLRGFIASAEGLGMEEEARILRQKRQNLAELSRKPAPPESKEVEERMRHRSGNLAYHVLGGIGWVSAPAEADLRPGRLADHELMNRVVAFVLSALLVLVCAGVALYRFRSTTFVRRMSKRIALLFTPVDFAWIIGAGVLLPFAFMQGISRLTPLGGRDGSFIAHGGMITAGQHLTAAVLMLLLPILLGSWRAGRRIGLPGMRSGRNTAGWTAVAGGFLAVLMFGIALFANDSGMLFSAAWDGDFNTDFLELDPFEVAPPAFSWVWIAVLLVGLMIVTLLGSGIRAIFTRRHHLLRRLVASRVLVPSYACGALLFSLESQLCHEAERHWVAQDRLLMSRPERPGLTEIEFAEVERERAHLREALDPAP
jgi:hypothetical protein